MNGLKVQVKRKSLSDSIRKQTPEFAIYENLFWT